MKKILLFLSVTMLLLFSNGFSDDKNFVVKDTKSKNKMSKEIKRNKKIEVMKLKKKTKENEKKELIEEKRRKKISNKFKNDMKSYEMEAVITTNKGVISLYLYPEAAPVNVANFVYLAKNNFYNGLKFHRIIPNVLVQGGDPLGTGIGTTGYFVSDEIVDWLNFENSGVLAMANSGPNTNSSQFFLTMTPLEQLNDKYTIIGEIISREELGVVKVLRESDIIRDIQIKGKNIDTFLGHFSEEVEQWDKILKK